MAYFRTGGGTDTSDANAVAGDILLNKTAYVNDEKVTGTMPNNGAWTPSNINPGGSVTIPAGYHNGSGKVTANANQNSGTKTITSSDTNWLTGNVDMGANNTYRYVNAVNVYNKGKTDGEANNKVVLDSLDVYCSTTASYRFNNNVKSITVKPAVAASVRLYTDQGGTIIKQDFLPANTQSTITYDSYDGKYIWLSGSGLEHLYNIKIEVK